MSVVVACHQLNTRPHNAQNDELSTKKLCCFQSNPLKHTAAEHVWWLLLLSSVHWQRSRHSADIMKHYH